MHQNELILCRILKFFLIDVNVYFMSISLVRLFILTSTTPHESGRNSFGKSKIAPNIDCFKYHKIKKIKQFPINTNLMLFILYH